MLFLHQCLLTYIDKSKKWGNAALAVYACHVPLFDVACSIPDTRPHFTPPSQTRAHTFRAYALGHRGIAMMALSASFNASCVQLAGNVGGWLGISMRHLGHGIAMQYARPALPG